MKFKDLEKLGFVKQYVSEIESGDKENIYYTYDFIGDFCLISSDSDDEVCFVDIFNTDIRFYETSDVKKLINIINKGIK
jgi:hypothetical protein